MKVRLLDFGTITADLGWAIDAGGVSTHSNPSPDTLRRDFQILEALIEHPKHGVILYDIGPAPNWKDLWPDPVKEVFAFTRHEEKNRLDKQLEKAGYTGDFSLPVETNIPANENREETYFRHTEASEQTGNTVSFEQAVRVQRSPLWPCPGMGPLKPATLEVDEEN